jgi:RNA polymerase-binding transcription factor DksA
MDKTKKPNPSKKKVSKSETRKVAPLPKVAPPVVPVDSGKRPPMEKPSKKTALRDSLLARKAPKKPIAFSLDEVRAIAKTVTAKAESTAKTTKVVVKPSVAALNAALEKPIKPNHIKAASLADILGFNPKRTKASEVIEDRNVPEKFKRYHKLLIDLRKHLTEGIERHSEETLKRSAKDDAGDLSSYGQHMADAGTDTFDRDFALSLVSNEQEALSEIEAAIKRVLDGTYGICEITAKPISKERLLAVPFTRYSAEAQKQIERNRHHSRTQAGLFGESGEEGGTIPHEDGAEE